MRPLPSRTVPRSRPPALAAKSIAPGSAARDTEATKLQRVVDEHLDSLWRFARRLGIREADVDDVLQEVIVIFAQRLPAVGRAKQKSFLFGTTFRVASEHRRKSWNTREVPQQDDDPEPVSEAPGADELLDDARARMELARVLDGLPIDVRAVFVLYEIEEHTMSEIAELLDIPPGTVASRLRRGRAHFEAEVARIHADSAAAEGRVP